MIPRHSLPFTLGKALSIILTPAPSVPATDLEKALSDALGVHSAILLPSVRVGIYMAVHSLRQADTLVVGPAYTCSVVHEAMSRSGARTRIVDAAPGSFLMSSGGISDAATEPDCALILSEVYGIPYDQTSLEKACRPGIRARIFDMAMCIPTPDKVQRLEKRDIALFSFGWGKPMYAGWGGVACFRDPVLAKQFRVMRDQLTVKDSFAVQFRRTCSTLLRVAANQRHIYGLWHEPNFYRWYMNQVSKRNQQQVPVPVQGATSSPPKPNATAFPPEWSQPMTEVNRKLTLSNLRISLL